MANSRLDVVINHALRTFSKFGKKGPECSTKEINDLRSLTNDIGVSDIHSLGSLLSGKRFSEFMRTKASPLDCLPVYEDNHISVGVFMLKEGAKLPIHDHPNMYGIIKVLEGVIKVTSYSLLDLDESIVLDDRQLFYNNPLKVVKFPPVLLEKQSESCMLTPKDKNIHEVECVQGPGAFLDILSPPYEEGNSNEPRVCHYFKEVEGGGEADGFLKLIQIARSF